MTTMHELKTWPPFYQHIVDGTKPFEVRKADRDFAVGQVLWLREWDPKTQEYTGREHDVRVTYVLDGGRFGVEPGYVVLGVRPL